VVTIEGGNRLMKKLPLLLVVAASLVTSAARAQDAIIDYQGYSYETGGFQPSNAGDILSILGIVDNIDPRFNIDLNNEEVTLYVTNLLSTGQVDQGGGVISVAYNGGSIDLYRDPSKNHDFSVNPPNPPATPNTFTDGSLFLGGTLSNFFLFVDNNTGSGAYEADCQFTSGSGLATLGQLNANGYTFGGVLDRRATANIPQGYDLAVDGVISVQVQVGVEQRSWGAVKELYRNGTR
jgi:hypothetical protein